jgi:hypothetical protein
MRARLIILIAANSTFDEDIVIPPARHVQLLGLGPWGLGNTALANFESSVPRNITIQTSLAAENVYRNQGAAFDARSVTVIGTLNNGTSVSTHSNYTNGAMISGNVIFQLVGSGSGATLEFQVLNGRIFGDIQQSGHTGLLSAWFFNSRFNSIAHTGLRIQRMVDCRTDGTINMSRYSLIDNTWFRGSVTVSSTTAGDVPPIGIFNSQFETITWNGPLRLDTASNFYFVNSGSTLVGTKTLLHSTS